jgi:hypothetical protein
MSSFMPVLAIAGVPAIVIVWVVLRNFTHVARALVVLLAGIVAIATGDKDRRESCHKVLDKVTRGD